MITAILMLALAAETSPSPRHPLLEFTLNETPQQLMARFDRPPRTSSGRGYQMLLFHALAPVSIEPGLPIDWAAAVATASCEGKYAYSFYIRDDGQIQSVLHQPDRAVPLGYFFPAGKYRDYEVSNASGFKFRYRVRKMDNGLLLVATLLQPDTKLLDQVLLIRETAIVAAFPLLRLQP